MNASSSSQADVPRRAVLGIALGVGLAASSYGLVRLTSSDGSPSPAADDGTETAIRPLDAAELTFKRDPAARCTLVLDRDSKQVATLTDGARTVTMTGPARVLAEVASTGASVHSTTRVHLAPRAWSPEQESAPWVKPWLTRTYRDRRPDVLDIAMQYIQGAPERRDAKGVRYAGDAAFGPYGGPGEARLEASDFYDFLGVPWTFIDGVTKQPEARRLGAVDCSGYLRLVLGYRLGYPLLSGNTAGPGLPRRAYAMAGLGPGRLLIPDTGRQPTDLSRLLPGDLVFFITDDVPGIDHSGIYLGLDSDGKHRFISSRGNPNGPTMGDVSGRSVLDGASMFTRGFRAARRI
ncbi:NlpC/P60 family protein [Luteipulveratus mongoliensis]|uniref:NlpC/P60 domain-containing protein n=1 Tax=Luteipulveratus mongoliensis TaxID=571913 RepID=A0A0K1JIJ9_9MICO|nr:NlpC/P60 family protein [Luteipulveratus mongoliensis]AKU16544.1 hypothetical protein VV02_12870 [Luteipulveratus mongoliensis]